MHNVGSEGLAHTLEIGKVTHGLHFDTDAEALHELGDMLRHHLVGFRIDMQYLHRFIFVGLEQITEEETQTKAEQTPQTYGLIE